MDAKFVTVRLITKNVEKSPHIPPHNLPKLSSRKLLLAKLAPRLALLLGRTSLTSPLILVISLVRTFGKKERSEIASAVIKFGTNPESDKTRWGIKSREVQIGEVISTRISLVITLKNLPIKKLTPYAIPRKSATHTRI